MSYKDDRLNQIEAEISKLTNLKRNLRQREQDIKAREKYMSDPSQFQFNSVKQLKSDLGSALAPHMMPVNVGALNEVAWPFYFQASVDFGVNPTFSSNNHMKGFFQVDQEAAFLLMSISVMYDVDSTNASACRKAPLQVDFIDRQSSRRFNSEPVPIQMIGDNSTPLILPTPMLIMPNAVLDLDVSGINTTPQAKTGSGLIQFSFFGYRTRIENANKVLSTIFG